VGALYILVFGIGSIVGMLAVSTVISLPIVLMAR
jgi:sulfite exporter TauE/SafE